MFRGLIFFLPTTGTRDSKRTHGISSPYAQLDGEKYCPVQKYLPSSSSDTSQIEFLHSLLGDEIFDGQSSSRGRVGRLDLVMLQRDAIAVNTFETLEDEAGDVAATQRGIGHAMSTVASGDEEAGVIRHATDPGMTICRTADDARPRGL